MKIYIRGKNIFPRFDGIKIKLIYGIPVIHKTWQEYASSTWNGVSTKTWETM